MELKKNKNIISVYNDSGILELSYIKENIVHVRYGKDFLQEDDSLILEERGKTIDDSVTISSEKRDASLFIYGGSVEATVSGDLFLTWRKSSDNSLLLREGKKEFIEIPVMKYTTGGEKPIINRVKTVDGERNFIENLKETEDHKAWQGRLYFEFADDEHIHGLGQGEDGIYDYRHHVQYLYQHNMRIPMPVMISDKGYGILFDCTSLMTFNDTETGSYMYFDTIPCLSYYFISGKNMDEIIAGIRFLTGDAAMPPKWSYGYIQSKEQYRTADELVDIASRYRDLNIPLDCVVQDWNTWEKDKWGNKILDPARYGNMRECAKKLHNLNVHTMISVWPNMNSGTENYDEFMEKGMLLNDLATYDAFDEKAREVYWDQAKRGLFDEGFDSFWCDSTEPFSGPDWGGEIKREPWKRFEIVGEEHKKYLPPEKANAYALVHAKGIYENQRKTTTDKRVLNLTRSGYAGGQKYGAFLWSGDTCASWETLKKQITESLNMAISGYPYWTLDIGGFFTVGKKTENRGCGCNNDPTPKWFWTGKYDEGVNDKGYCELYVRWLEMGVFLPMFRSHGTDTPREIWNFGNEGDPFYDAIASSIRLRYSLMPYIYSMAGAVRLESDTIMRSLIFDFPYDKKSALIDHEFMFGRSILVCPVTSPMYYEDGSRGIEREKTWDCYLPDGFHWIDMRDGKRYGGGQTVTVPAEIDSIPVFIKSGSIIPMRKNLSYAMEDNNEPLELHIYSGNDGSFTYYDDAGDDYSYENGEYELVKLNYSDKDSILSISDREGSFTGMRPETDIKIYLDNSLIKEITYTGKRIKLVL